MRRVTGRVYSAGAVPNSPSSPPVSSVVPPPYPTIPSTWRQIGIGVAVVLISGALLGVATKVFARPQVCA